METETDQAARHLECAATLMQIADEMRATDGATADKLLRVAESYQRMAEKLMRGITSRNSN